MKAIFVSEQSCSGDSHTFPLAQFSDDQTETMERLLKELVVDAELSNDDVSFHIDDYDAPPFNPQSLEAIRGPKRGKDVVVPKKQEPSSYELNRHIGNEPF